MLKWILSLSCIPVTKGLQAQSPLSSCSQAADLEIAGSDMWGMVMLISKVDKDPNDSLTYVVRARITGINNIITVSRLCFTKIGEES